MTGWSLKLSWIAEADSFTLASLGTTWEMTCWGVIATTARECFVSLFGDATVTSCLVM